LGTLKIVAIIIMGDIEYTKLSLPLHSESSPRPNSGKRATAKLIAGISCLAIFGYVMSATYFSTPEASAINLNFSEARLGELVEQYQLELASSPVKVANLGNARESNQGLVMSKDNALAAFLNLQNKIEVWNVEKKELVAKLTHSDSELSNLIFTPDGKYLISSSRSEGLIKTWDLATMSLYGNIQVETFYSDLRVTSDSKYLVHCSMYEVIFWDLVTQTKSNALQINYNFGFIVDFTMSPNGKYLAIGVYPGYIQVYDLSTRGVIAIINNEAEPSKLTISDDGKIVATGDFGTNLTKVWDVENGELITKIQHRGGVFNIVLSPDGRFVISTAFDSTAIVYDLKAKKLNQKIRRFVGASAFTRDSKFLLATNKNFVEVIDLETKTKVATLKHLKAVNNILLSDNGEYLLASTYWSVYLWSLKELYS
jgi:WD40 repeat protein